MGDLIPLAPKAPTLLHRQLQASLDHERAKQDLIMALDQLRLDIAMTQSLTEAWAVYTAVKALAKEVLAVVDTAAKRCDDILDRM